VHFAGTFQTAEREAMTFEGAQKKLSEVADNIELIIKGKRKAIELAIVTLLARGHLLIEDVPGVGKTVLSHALAMSLNCSFRRIQFTSDLLPSDIIGVNIFNPGSGSFEFRRGPIFSNIVLADEINRATPKTQSSLLESMNESQVSIENETITLSKPFMVIATQNPKEHYGTFPLPESQLDRFQMRISIGYPRREFERKIVIGQRTSEKIKGLIPVLDAEEVIQLQRMVETVKMDEAILNYLMEIVEKTRENERFELGASPRGAIAFYRNAQAHALVEGRDYCVPDDVKLLAVPSLAHRVILRSRRRDVGWSSSEAAEAISELVASIPVPR
jgi:MoxR-like ATPase